MSVELDTFRAACCSPPSWLDYVLVSQRHRQPVSSHGCLHVYRAPWSWGRRQHTDLSDHFAVSCSFAFPR